MSSIADSAARVDSVQQHQRRNRAQLSCNQCRQGKLKCDRTLPCNQCTKRGKETSCAFLPPPVRQRPAKTVQKRLKNLENLVKNLMNDETSGNILPGHPSSGGNIPTAGSFSETSTLDRSPPNPRSISGRERIVSEPSLPGDIDGVLHATNAFGRVVVNPHETTYVGATHWAAILNELEEVKTYFDEHTPDGAFEESYSWEIRQQAPALLLGVSNANNKNDLIFSLPPKSDVDRLISRYFNSNHPAMNIIHKPTFQKEYREFWEDPYDKPVMWIGLLFSMMALATFFTHRAGDEAIESRAPAMDLVQFYRTLSSQSLIVGNYTKPGRYTLETLVLYFEGEFTMKGDAQSRSWLLNGLTLRLALRMGLHRDAANHPNLSPFQGEMRRRVWHLLLQFEMLLSFHVGLPSMTQGLQSDTLPPHNLFDEDFSEDSAELPPSRPETELTPNTYTICKVRIAKVFGKITEQANALAPPTYEDVMELDKRLREAFASVPDSLMARPFQESITETPETVMQRFNLVLLFNKSICMLHRRYLSTESTNKRFNYSKTSCLSSSLEILHFQYAIHLATLPGGVLGRYRWFLNTLTIHDFLLASMIVYLFLTTGIDVQSGSIHSISGSKKSLQDDLMKVLETSYDIWTKSTTATGDALRARGVLYSMLVNLKERGFAISALLRDEEIAPNEEGIFLGSVLETNIANGSFPPMLSEDFGFMIDSTSNLDWGLWDAQVNTAGSLQPLPDFQPPPLDLLSSMTGSNVVFPPNVAFSVLQNMRFDGTPDNNLFQT